MTVNFVAIGNQYIDEVQQWSVAYSENGADWTPKIIDSGIALYNVAYGKDGEGNPLWVIVGSGGVGNSHGRVWTSPDGINWSIFSPAIFDASPIKTIAYNNGLWIAGCNGMLAVGPVGYSTDGSTWTVPGLDSNIYTMVPGPAVAGSQYYFLQYINDKFFLWGDNGTTGDPVFAQSSDGLDWTAIAITDTPLDGVNERLYDMTYGNGIYAVIGYNACNLFTTTDFITWSASKNEESGCMASVATDGTNFVASGCELWVSSDGATWSQEAETVIEAGWYDTTLYNSSLGLFVSLVANQTTDSIISSSNRTTWTTRFEQGSPMFNFVTFATTTEASPAPAAVVSNKPKIIFLKMI